MKLEFLDHLNGDGKHPYDSPKPPKSRGQAEGPGQARGLGQAENSGQPKQLIRLCDFNPPEAGKLMKIIQEEILGKQRSVDLEALDFIDPVNCSLTLRIARTDRGIRTLDNRHFTCDLTLSKYKEMVLLIWPFAKTAEGHQWLYDIDTPIGFLLSPGSPGSW